jgi:hypothetical protein
MLLDIVVSVSDRRPRHPTLASFMTFVVATVAFFNLNSPVEFCGVWLIDDSRFPSRTSKSSTHNPTHNSCDQQASEVSESRTPPY